MVFTQAKMDALKVVSDSYFAYDEELNAKVSQFESSVKNSIGEFDFKFVLEKSDPVVSVDAPEAEGICSYKELAWTFFYGPLPMQYEAGWHLVIRSFKSKESEYSDESKYSDKLIIKALLATDLEKELAISKFDDFLDGFKAALDTHVVKLAIK